MVIVPSREEASAVQSASRKSVLGGCCGRRVWRAVRENHRSASSIGVAMPPRTPFRLSKKMGRASPKTASCLRRRRTSRADSSSEVVSSGT